jgi:hypothetical protein
MVRLLEPANWADRALVGVKDYRGLATFGRALVNTQPKLFFFSRAKL